MQKKDFFLNLLFILFIFFFTLAIYIKTLSHSVYFGDSGELITGAKTLGILHPPGYPLYTMLGHLFTYLPFGTLPFKVNLFSAVTSSLTCVFIFLSILKLTGNRFAALGGSLFLAFSYLFWLYCLVAEVFPLNNLFIAVIIYLSLLIFQNPQNRKILYLLAFVFGLALTHHHTILFLTPALLFLVLVTNFKILLQPKSVVLTIFFSFLGLLPYLYLPIRASQHPLLTWGNTDTIQGFFHHLLRRDYGTFLFGAGSNIKPFNIDVLIFYFSSLFWHFLGVGLIFAILGFLFSYKMRKVFIFLLLAFIFLGPLFIFLTRSQIVGNIFAKGTLERFFLSSYLIIAIWIGLGLAVVVSLVPKFLKPLAILLTFIFVLPLALNSSKVDQSKNFLYEEFGRKTFEILPQNAVLLMSGDRVAMIARYLQIAQHNRPDLKFLQLTMIPDNWYKDNLKQRYPDLVFPWDKFVPMKLSEIDLGRIICQDIVPNYPTFIEEVTVGFDPNNMKDCSLSPVGHLVKLEKGESKVTVDQLLTEEENFWQPLQKTLLQKKPDDLRTRTILWRSYSEPRVYLGQVFERMGRKDLANKIYQDAFEISPDNSQAAHLIAKKYLDEKDFLKAIEWEEKAIKIDPTEAEPYRILGLVYLNEKKDSTKAQFFFQKYLEIAKPSKEKETVQKLMQQLKQEQK